MIMAIMKVTGKMSVVEAAMQRIQNVFDNGVKVYLAFSGGKDTLCLCGMIYELAMAGKIDLHQLTVCFIDEESIYPSMLEMTYEWRNKFVRMGAEFRWYCLPVKQVSMLRQLQDEESWITWEPGKEDIWMREAPPYAIRRDPALEYAGQMNYQTFLPKVSKDGLMMVGVRACESVQRIKYLATVSMTAGSCTGNNLIYPIYDWHDSDVWLYIKEHRLKFPEAYIDLYRVGVNRHQLRLCQFFGHESITGLRYVAETDPDLWARIQRREPNAYLALLYWDSEMFHRSTVKRRKLEANQEKKDYKQLCRHMLFEAPEEYFTTEARRAIAEDYRKLFVKSFSFMTERHFKKMYEGLRAGDPKKRTLRAIYTDIFTDYVKYSRKTSPSGRKGGE
jgi:predicted phosphoadenosine phosphosulfate sulfurtransferase